jgi:hypothetical protein
MSYEELIRKQTARYGPKALLFAAERNDTLSSSTFDSVDLQYMNTISEDQLTRHLKKVYETSELFLSKYLSSLSSKINSRKTSVKHKDAKP